MIAPEPIRRSWHASRPGAPSRRPPMALGSVVGILFLAVGACGNSTLDLFDPDVGLLAHWALDENQAGTPTADSSGFGLGGTPSANPPVPTSDVPPVHFSDPHSLMFDGQGQWILIGNPPLLGAGGSISIAAWVRPTAIDGYRNLVAHGYRNDPNQDVALRLKMGTYQFTYWDSNDHQAVAPIPASDVGAWIHLCGVFDGSTYSIYRNGALAGSTADAIAPPPNIDAPWAIGARAPQPNNNTLERLLQGELDDVRIYGRALSAAEVQALYRR